MKTLQVWPLTPSFVSPCRAAMKVGVLVLVSQELVLVPRVLLARQHVRQDQGR